MTAYTQNILSFFSENTSQTIRVCGKDAKEILLANQTVTIKGNIRYLQIMPLGLETYAVRLLPVGWDKEFGTITLAARSKWLTTEKTLDIKPAH